LEAGLNASLELQCETMGSGTKHGRPGFEAGLEDLKAMEIGAKQYDKEGALFWTSKRRKSRRAKNRPPQFKIPAVAVAGQISFTRNKRLYKFATMKGSKRDQNCTPRGNHFDFKRVHFLTFLKHISLHGGPKVDPQQVESGASLKFRF